ncbi:MAG: carboxypeptidase-like regulatory domain-containing protein [Chloracidobacterium sp.]|nr:carboxypeptidase-like regulatory domain-containing protein [Chloracidobacterium sp.]MDW8216969.1 carboxypeptidase-like regulatory domain-containing protein [Acidobacteriota bacterium]
MGNRKPTPPNILPAGTPALSECMRYLIGGFLLSLVLLAAGPATVAASKRSEGCRVTGVIMDSHGTPIAHAVVSLLRDGNDQEVVVTTASDRNGRFTLSRLSPGLYRLLAAARGFQTLMTERLTLTPGDATPMRLTLRPAPDAKTSGVNPVKYQNRRHRSIFNAAPAAAASASPSLQTTFLAGSPGYSAQAVAEVRPGLEVGALLRRDWAGRNTMVGGAVRYVTDQHQVIVRMATDRITLANLSPDEAPPAPPVFFRRTTTQAADAWQVTEALQLVYGFDYIQMGRAQATAWQPRVAAHWRPCPSLHFHTALTADGRATPDWVGAEGVLFAEDFPTPPTPAAGDADGLVATRALRAEFGVAWRFSPKVTAQTFAYQDWLDGRAWPAAAQMAARMNGRAQGGGGVVAYRPHHRLTISTAYAAGRAPAVAPDSGSRTATTYHVVAVVAETFLPATGTRLSIGYRGATGAAVHAIDPLTARLPWTESGLSFAFVQALPAWLTPLGRWEAVVEGRNLDERRGEITGLSAQFGLPYRRLVRGGLRVRF